VKVTVTGGCSSVEHARVMIRVCMSLSGLVKTYVLRKIFRFVIFFIDFLNFIFYAFRCSLPMVQIVC